MTYTFNEKDSINYRMSKRQVKKLVENILHDEFGIVDLQPWLSSKLSFDIETTSLYQYSLAAKKIKAQMGFMYIWMVGINGQCIHGRTWEDFVELVELINSTLQGSEYPSIQVICWVHNLEFEFQFMRKYFKFKAEDLFFGRKRKVMYAKYGNIVFRDSYIYTGKKLESVAEDLTKYKVNKKVGDLDYSKIRTKSTYLNEKEMSYCISDVIILNNFMQEEIEHHGMEYIIKNLTKTSKVRYDMRANGLYMFNKDGKRVSHTMNRKLIRSQTLTGDDYRLMRRVYQGGFTHANSLNVCRVFHKVHHRDFTSEFPSCLLAEKYPCGKFTEIENITQEQFNYYMEKQDDFGCLFDCEVTNIVSKGEGDDIISISKCWNLTSSLKAKWIKEGKLLDNNGRIKECIGTVKLAFNEIDFEEFKKFYTYGKIKITKFKYAPKSYLPKFLIEGILYYYKLKTEYKNVDGKEREYQEAKEKLNSIYGMLVEDLIHAMEEVYNVETNEYNEEELVEVIIDGETKKVKIDSQTIPDEKLDVIIKKYNNNKKRFTYFPAGIWCTSYARRNLFSAILELGQDYIYSDTDSCFYINNEKHQDYFDSYNKEITEKIERCLKFYDIDPEESRPKDRDGIRHQLGVWDWDTEPKVDKKTGEIIDMTYQTFKTLGAKRYLYTQRNKKGVLELHSTIAGLGKKKGCQYLANYNDNNEIILNKNHYVDYAESFERFRDDLTVPAEHTGKLTHYYIDNEVEMEVEDYQGHKETIKSLSGIVLVPCEFNLGMNDDFLEMLDKYYSEVDLTDSVFEESLVVIK